MSGVHGPSARLIEGKVLLAGASVLAYELPVLVVEGAADKNRVGSQAPVPQAQPAERVRRFVPKVRWVLVVHRSHATRFASAASYRG